MGCNEFYVVFEILRGVMAFLVLFEQILIKLFAPHSESFTKYDAFRLLIFDLCAAYYFRPRMYPENFGGKMQF